MSIKALIPARAGSVRVKNKNVRPFAGSTLLEVKIRQLMRIKELDGVIVNSESDEILEIARALGAETVKRADYFASSTVSINEVYRNIAENFDADVMVYANCTNPLLKDESICSCLQAFAEMPCEFDSLNTAHLIKEFLWLDGKAINYDPTRMPKSQNLPDILALNFAVNIIRRADILASGSIVGRHPRLFPISQMEATDIDNECDFIFAETIYGQHSPCHGGSGYGRLPHGLFGVLL